MSFSTPVAADGPLAGWWTRGGALAIDVLITTGIELALLLIVWAISGSPRLTFADAETLLVEVGLPVTVLYAPLLLARPGERNGQTIGKWAMGIRVINEGGLPVSLATAFRRETLGRQLPALLTYGVYVPIDYLWPLRDLRRQALHDKIGRTLVVSAAGTGPVAPDGLGDGRARAWTNGRNGSADTAEPVRGDWLPPVAPTPEDAE